MARHNTTKVLPLCNQTKLTLIVTLTLTNTVTLTLTQIETGECCGFEIVDRSSSPGQRRSATATPAHRRSDLVLFGGRR